MKNKSQLYYMEDELYYVLSYTTGKEMLCVIAKICYVKVLNTRDDINMEDSKAH